MNWDDQGACKGAPFELFLYHESDSPAAKGMSNEERFDLNQSNAYLAGEICIECPIMFACAANATEQEKYWTVRGGEPSGRFVAEAARYGRWDDTEEEPAFKMRGEGRTCARGHFVQGGGRCKMCKKAAKKAWDSRARAAAGQKRKTEAQ